MKLSEKISKMKSLASDFEYLRDEFNSSKPWVSRPDGEVTFDAIMEWVSENDYLVEHMIKVANDMKELEK